MVSSVFFFNDTATTEIYTLSLHDALPISLHASLLTSSKRREPLKHTQWSLIHIAPVIKGIATTRRISSYAGAVQGRSESLGINATRSSGATTGEETVLTGISCRDG